MPSKTYGKINGREKDFIILARTRFMVVWEKQVFSQKKILMIPILHTQLQRQVQITLYGPNHFPEKLIPLFINNIIQEKPLPVYGDGNFTRDWLYVKDHAIAIDLAFHKGKEQSTYNIGGYNEWKNIDLVLLLCKLMDERLNRPSGTSRKLITYVKDRPGHDLRYAIDASKITKELGWKPLLTFEEGLSETIDWYLNNEGWLQSVTSGEYLEYYKKQYQ